jgi:hypothetical protein
VRVARILSEELFAGVPFVGEDEGIWDEIPAVRLANDFLDLRIELGGDPESGYTLQILAAHFPWREIAPDDAEKVDVDLSTFVALLLGRIENVAIKGAS